MTSNICVSLVSAPKITSAIQSKVKIILRSPPIKGLTSLVIMFCPRITLHILLIQYPTPRIPSKTLQQDPLNHLPKYPLY